MTLNKMVNPDIPTSLKVLIRSSFGLMFFSPIIIKEGLSVLRSKNTKLQLIRIILMSMAMGGTYFTYSNLPFTIATSIGFTSPIFTAVLSYFILKDRLAFGQWVAIIVGYAGVLLITNPQGGITSAIYVAIFSNIITGLGVILTKQLTAIDSRNTIVILGNVGVVCITSIWSLVYWLISLNLQGLGPIVWALPNWNDLALLMGMGFLGAFSQMSYITALSYASPSFLSPFEYSRLIIVVPISLAFGEAFPQQQEIIGIIVIISTTLYMTWKGSRREQ